MLCVIRIKATTTIRLESHKELRQIARKNGNKTVMKRTANGFVTVITSPVIWYKVLGEHRAFRGIVTPIVHLAASETFSQIDTQRRLHYSIISRRELRMTRLLPRMRWEIPLCG